MFIDLALYIARTQHTITIAERIKLSAVGHGLLLKWSDETENTTNEERRKQLGFNIAQLSSYMVDNDLYGVDSVEAYRFITA